MTWSATASCRRQCNCMTKRASRRRVSPTSPSGLVLDRQPCIVISRLPSDLIQSCGAHVWQEMRPPVPDDAAVVFEGSATDAERIERLVAEVDAFYARGALRLGLAGRDRDLVPELDGFLRAVEAGVEALVREALRHAGKPEPAVQAVIGLMSFRGLGFIPQDQAVCNRNGPIQSQADQMRNRPRLSGGAPDYVPESIALSSPKARPGRQQSVFRNTGWARPAGRHSHRS